MFEYLQFLSLWPNAAKGWLAFNSCFRAATRGFCYNAICTPNYGGEIIHGRIIVGSTPSCSVTALHYYTLFWGRYCSTVHAVCIESIHTGAGSSILRFHRFVPFTFLYRFFFGIPLLLTNVIYAYGVLASTSLVGVFLLYTTSRISYYMTRVATS